MSHPSARRNRRAAVALLTAFAAAISVASADATAASADTPQSWVVATGLDNPRQLSIGAGGAIYVAEAGTGGDGVCVPDPEDPTASECLGDTGAVTEIRRGTQTRIITGLASLAGPDGSGATGPSAVSVRGNTIAVLMGLGGDLDKRAVLGAGGAALGTVLTGRIGGALSVAADVTAYEAAANPDGGEVDSNPSGFVDVNSKRWAVADAGANAVVSVGGNLPDTTLAVLPPVLAVPPWGGDPIPAQSVPTQVVTGPDGAYYVSELLGFPFPAGESRIWRVVPGQQPTVYATGLSNVTSLVWQHQTLYAVQFSDGSLLSEEPPIGSLREVVPGAEEHPAVLAGLLAPYGVAVHGKTAYVSVGAILPGAGEVHAVDLG
ncbi:ScyD/ScyE family protein [Microbacterium sp. zg.B48]|uniref:ScyD/ScyE family protein n=1 Tax=Microbacterium sp. zg.B48 TaxID=2969408 RepID=UPI00214B147D|nr:ScyD/ScyE family protein [Microbacterium sp. zg.B48]MCR2762182.1 ScyD/ScyE family protein [Microbacterium sp. zg.B48]